MEETKKRCCCKKKNFTETKDVKEYPGLAIDNADAEKVDPALVKERTKTLNNNPRNDE